MGNLMGFCYFEIYISLYDLKQRSCCGVVYGVLVVYSWRLKLGIYLVYLFYWEWSLGFVEI